MALQSTYVWCFEFVSAIVAHKTSGENVALVDQTIKGALISAFTAVRREEVP